MEEQLKALDESIKHWERIVDMSKQELATDDSRCPLCILNWTNYCEHCIIKKDTNEIKCYGTVFYGTSKYKGYHPKKDKEMLAYLKSLKERTITSMKEELKVGDLVKIIDGSYAVKVNNYEEYTAIGHSQEIFKIKSFIFDEFLVVSNTSVHNVFIQNTRTGEIYLHSKAFIRKVNPKIKEITIKEITIEELEKQFGCKIKFIKQKQA